MQLLLQFSSFSFYFSTDFVSLILFPLKWKARHPGNKFKEQEIQNNS